MPSRTIARSLLGHRLLDTNPPAVCQPISSLPVWSPTYLSVWAILVTRARESGLREEGGRGGYGNRAGATGNRDNRTGKIREMVTEMDGRTGRNQQREIEDLFMG